MSPQEVDELNIFQALMEGFKRAINILAKRTSVSCASIVAKHSHNLYIKELCKQDLYKKYGFDSHKGYGTKLHLDKLKEHSPCEIHRMSDKPVKNSIK